MSDKKPCIHCDRNIDAHAKLCVYCNWDQSVPPPSPEVEQATVGAAPAYVAPKDHRLRNRVIGVAAFVVLLVVAFSVGTFMHGFDPNEVSTMKDKQVVTVTQGTAAPAPGRADLQVVPANPNNTVAGEAPITSAPATTTAAGVPNEYQRNDATAATSEEYAQLAARAKAERQTLGVDPRTVGGPAYGGAAPARPRRETAPQRTVASSLPPGSAVPPMTSGVSGEPRRGQIVVRTRPQPEYQPIPSIHVDRDTVARLDLTVGADGRVQDVNILNAIPGETAKLIAAVQAWRFKPATENGTPVPSHFAVDVSFHAR